MPDLRGRLLRRLRAKTLCVLCALCVVLYAFVVVKEYNLRAVNFITLSAPPLSTRASVRSHLSFSLSLSLYNAPYRAHGSRLSTRFSLSPPTSDSDSEHLSESYGQVWGWTPLLVHGGEFEVVKAAISRLWVRAAARKPSAAPP